MNSDDINSEFINITYTYPLVHQLWNSSTIWIWHRKQDLQGKLVGSC